MQKFTRSYFFLISIAALIILIDQITKAFVLSRLPVEGDTWAPWSWLLPYARIIHWTNTGVAFGMFQGQGNFFIFLAIIVAAAIIYYYPKVAPGDWLIRLAMGMQLGGALGNLVDRIVRGRVVDFISVGTFPVFNVADSSITIGVCVLVLALWLEDRREKKAALAASGPSPELEEQPETPLEPVSVDEHASDNHKAAG